MASAIDALVQGGCSQRRGRSDCPKPLSKRMPNEHLIYFGDTAHVPYGSKSKEAVTRFSLAIAHFLAAKGIPYESRFRLDALDHGASTLTHHARRSKATTPRVYGVGYPVRVMQIFCITI